MCRRRSLLRAFLLVWSTTLLAEENYVARASRLGFDKRLHNNETAVRQTRRWCAIEGYSGCNPTGT